MDTDVLKRYSAVEVVLLAIFALGLGLSLLVVQARGRVELGEPVALPGAGLAAAIPQGDQWQSAGGWRYESDNAFVLLSLMRIGGRPVMHIRWRYVLCDEPTDPQQLLQSRADSAGGRLIPLGRIEGPIAMVAGRIYTPDPTGQDYLVGVAPLDFGRQLELLISYRSDGWFAENVFRTLAAGVQYERAAALQAGAQAVGQFTKAFDRHTADLFDASAPQEMRLMIKDTSDRPLGFIENRFFSHHDDEQTDGHYRITTRYLEPGGAYSESDLWLDAEEDTFTWTTQTWPPRSRRPRLTELRSNTRQRITLTTNTERERAFQRTAMMLPEPLLPAFVAGVVHTDTAEIIIDVLTGSGFVVPTRLAVIDTEQSHVRASNQITVVRADYLHMDGSFDELIFDRQGRYIGRFEQVPQQPARLWEQAEAEQLKNTFGQRYEQSSRRNFQ